MTKNEALKLALEALEESHPEAYRHTITAIKESLAQPEQEPVAWMNDMGTHIDLNVSGRGTPLYTTPPQRKPLTDEEVNKLVDDEDWYNDPHGFARAIETALRSKNT